jgi:hypothetical protein
MWKRLFLTRNISDAALDQLESEFDVISGKIEQLQRIEVLPLLENRRPLRMQLQRGLNP